MAAARSDRTIASIYSALLGEIEWQDVVGDVASATGADMATLFYHDMAAGRGAITLASGISEAIQRDYASHFAPLNPWMAQIASAPIGEAIVGEQIVSRGRFLRTEYYNDFLKPHDQESGVGVTVRRDDSCFFLFSVLSGDSNFERNSRRAAYLTRLAPHLRRVSDFYQRQGSGAIIGVADGVDAAGGIATVVVSTAARVICASRSGEAILASGDLLRIEASGRVSFRDSMAQSLFDHALRGRHSDLLTKTLNVGDREITFVRVTEDSGSAIFMGGAVAIMLAPRGGPLMPGAERVAAQFRLTPAEKRVLEGIVSGARPAEIAASAGVALETVRSQLKAIYGKTGTNRQAELVRLATGLSNTGDGRHDGSRKRF